MHIDINFIHPSLPQSDRELFFGPLTNEDQFIFVEERWLLAHVMHAAGVFRSVKQARNSGWNKPIPKGFSEYIVGKLRNKITILNTWED